MSLSLSKLAQAWSSAPPSPLDAAAARRRAAGLPVIDLITANPHEHGLVFPAERLAEISRNAMQSIGVYHPDPLGALAGREAVAAWHARRGAVADPARIALTPGTSLAYFYALRLLCDAGGEILVPSPGYPLFDDLCAIAGVGMRRYALRRDAAGWALDPDEIDFQCTRRTRAIMVVSPHNPTGAMPTQEHWSAFAEICRRRNLALVVDEVFSECLAPGSGNYLRPEPSEFPLLISLNGLSKMLSLPGWKLGWMRIEGDLDKTLPFMRALAHLNDAFLPLPDLQQAMLPALLNEEAAVLALSQEIARRRELAVAALHAAGFAPDPFPSGVYLCVPRSPPGADLQFAAQALDNHGVLIHPGAYYELPAHWVLTCIAEPETLLMAINLLNSPAK